MQVLGEGKHFAKLLRVQWTKILFALAIASVAAILVTLALLQVNILAADINRDALRSNVEQAFKSGALSATWLPLSDNVRGAHQWNDCLILSMALDTRDTALRRGLSPFNIGQSESTCAYLYKAVMTGERTPTNAKLYYHRYIHGNVALATVLVSALPLATVRKLLDAAMFFSIVALIGFSILVMARNSGVKLPNTRPPHVIRASATRASVVLLSAMILLLFYGLPYYSMSLNHFPCDILIVAYLYIVLIFDFSEIEPFRIALIHAVFGVFTAYFEFLNGGIPLSISFILIGYAATAIGPNRAAAIDGAVTSVFAFCAGVGLAFVVKLALTASVFGVSVLTDFGDGLSYRMAGEKVGLFEMLDGLAWTADYIGAGWRWLGRLLLFGSMGLFVISVVQMWRRRGQIQNWQQPLLLGLAFLTIVLWFVVFRQHSHQHNIFMVRIVVGMIDSAIILVIVTFAADLAVHIKMLAGLLVGDEARMGAAGDQRINAEVAEPNAAVYRRAADSSI